MWPSDKNPQIRSFASSRFLERLSFAKLEDSAPKASECRTLAKTLFSSLYSNLNDLPYVYFSSGVTEALSWATRSGSTRVLPDEYRYVLSLPGVSSSTDPSDRLLVSSPQSSTGRHLDLYAPVFASQTSIALDASYLMASDLTHNKVLPNNVDCLMLGVSKSHDLSGQRFGVMFSRKPILGIHQLQYDYGYFSSLTLSVLKALSLDPLNSLYLDNRHFADLYAKAGLDIGNILLFGVDVANRRRIPWYWL